MSSELGRAIRSLRRDSATSLLAILLLALTIGVTGAVYAVVEAVILGRHAMDAPDRTVVVWQRDDARSAPIVEAAFDEVATWRQHSSSFESLGVFGSVNWTLSLIDADTRTRAPYAAVSSSFFDVVGTPPALGRTLSAADDRDSEPQTAVISDPFWRERFGADPSVVGRVVRVQDDIEGPVRSVQIVGVMPAAFDFPRGARLWLPAAPSLRAFARRAGDDAGGYFAGLRVFYAIGRLRPEIGPAQAARDLAAIARRPDGLRATAPPTSVVVMPVKDYLLGPAQPVLWTMLGGALLMVALACSSIAGLQLFRSARRDRALAVQLALGAARTRLIVRVLLEGAVLAAAGTVGAVGVGWAVSTLLISAAPLDVPRLAESSIVAGPVVLAMVTLAMAAAVLSGVWPAIFIGQIDAGRTLTSGGRAVMHPRERRLHGIVVGWQVAVAVMLLAGAALFVRSVQNLDRTALGFRAGNLISVQVQPSVTDLERSDRFFRTLLTQLGDHSDVTSAAAVYLRPLSGPIGNDATPIFPGQESATPAVASPRNASANLESVTPGYFRTLGTRILAGRDFAATDDAAAPNVVIVSASAAARYWPDRDPIGQRLVAGGQRQSGAQDELQWQTVVGVVEDVRYRGLTDPRPDVYLPAAQSTLRVKDVMVRSGVPADRLAAIVREVARELDPAVDVGEVVMMSDAVARESAPWRFAMRTLTLFGGLAALLATVGLAGVVSLVVAQRRKELAVRAALGATPRQLRAHVLEGIAWTTGIATAAGLIGSLALGRAVAGVLVATVPYDPVSLGAAALVTLCAAAVGCALPSRRAAAIAPTEALRD